jgi:hypothetical protein
MLGEIRNSYLGEGILGFKMMLVLVSREYIATSGGSKNRSPWVCFSSLLKQLVQEQPFVPEKPLRAPLEQTNAPLM